MRIRTVKGLKRKLLSLEKQYKKEEISIDHGVAVFGYDHFEYIEPTFENHFTESIIIYVKDFDFNNRIIEYMTLTDENLRKPNGDKDYYKEFVTCIWEKEFPTILYIREYTYK